MIWKASLEIPWFWTALQTVSMRPGKHYQEVWVPCGSSAGRSIRLSVKGRNQGCPCQTTAIIAISWTPCCRISSSRRMNGVNAYGLMFVHGWARASTASASGSGLELKNLLRCCALLQIGRHQMDPISSPELERSPDSTSWFCVCFNILLPWDMLCVHSYLPH